MNSEPNFDTLISPHQLQTFLMSEHLRLFDCRFQLGDPQAGVVAYRHNHIGNAIYVHLNEDLSSPMTNSSGRHPLPALDVISEKLSRWGVDADSQVVVYDQSNDAMAARMWWLLRYLGHQRVAVLDGGYDGWVRCGIAVNNRPAVFHASQFVAVKDDALLVTTQEVEAVVKNGDRTIIDARGANRYSGEIEPIDKIGGHIPGALNRPFLDNLDENQEFKKPALLHKEFSLLLADGIEAGSVVHSCGSGVTACHNLLAMKIAGLQGSRLYAGSWSEWITNPARPIERGTTARKALP